MNPGHTEAMPVRSSLVARVRDLFRRAGHLLAPYYPPLRNWHFLMIQSLVVFIAIGHTVHETGVVPYYVELYMLPLGLFLVPVVYAALVFGLAGAVATALWVTILSAPAILYLHHGLGAFAELFQIAIVVVVAFLVGRQVDREKDARRQAETAVTALQASRRRYRSLFESSPIAILALDRSGVISEANPAASVLFRKDAASLKGTSMIDLLWTLGEPRLLESFQTGGRAAKTLAIKPPEGSELYLQQTLTEASDDQGNLVTQVLFSDITKEYTRQASLKAYTSHIIGAQEEERHRIARELHDEILQSLILLYRRLDREAGASEPATSSILGALQEAKMMATQVIEELRDFTRALRPPILDDLGVVTSIRRLLAGIEERSEIRCKLEVVGEDRRLPSETELGMFRIAQEALRNIERHAEATRVSVSVSFAPPGARLEVADNGTGFAVPVDARDLVARKRLGIVSMQERAQLLGGALEIRSKPGGGTRVILSLPAVSGLAGADNRPAVL